MGEVQRYWQQVSMNAAGTIRRDEVLVAKSFFQAQFPDFIEGGEPLSDRFVQRWLMRQLETNGDMAAEAELCLRCYISNAIEDICWEMERRFGEARGVQCVELLPLVLEPVRLGSRTATIAHSTYQSVTHKILRTFNPEQSSLSTWTKRLVCSDPTFHHALMEQGVYLISDWAALNAVRNTEQLRRILTDFYALTPVEIERDCQLLESFHAVYRRDRAQKGRDRSRCKPPTKEQLQQMCDRLLAVSTLSDIPQPADIQPMLQALADKVRQYRIAIRTRKLPADSLDDEPLRAKRVLEQPASSDGDDDQNAFLTTYRQELQRELDGVLAAVLADRLAVHRRKKPPTDQLFLDALYRFHCQGQSMTDIAPHVGLKKQFQVSRLLKLDQLRSDVGDRLLLLLRDRVLDLAQAYADPTRLKTLSQTLNQALTTQIEQLMQAAKADTFTAHRTNSLFTQRLCDHLTQLYRSTTL